MSQQTDAAKAASAKGGRATRNQADPDFYHDIGTAGGNALVAKHGRAHMAEIGRKGGLRTSEKRGSAHYQAIGHTGGTKLRETRGRQFYVMMAEKSHAARAAKRAAKDLGGL